MSVVVPGSLLFQLLAGFLEAGPGINELALVSTEPGGDPALFRVGGVTGAGGGLAGDIFVGAPDPQTGVRRREMVVLIQYKKDERTRGRDDVLYGELTVHVRGPATERNPDGMMLVALVLHDYVWIKGINGEAPTKPWIELPEPDDSVPVPAPSDPPPIDDAERAERVLDVQAARDEFSPMDLDEGKVNAFLQGRSSLREFHDDNVARAGTHDPSKHRPGRPY